MGWVAFGSTESPNGLDGSHSDETAILRLLTWPARAGAGLGMRAARTNSKRPGRTKSSRHPNSLQFGAALDHAVVLIDTICCLAGDGHLIGNQSSPDVKQLRRAIADHDTPYLFEQLMVAFSMQGISDHAAYTYMERHGRLTWRDLDRATSRQATCCKLRSYWTFHDCSYRKEAQTCGEPEILPVCPVPKHDLRNGRLNQTGYSLFMFIRDVADGDFVGWIDDQLHDSSKGSIRRREMRMRSALVEPLRNLFGVSDKVLNMTLAWLLISAPPSKPLWLATGVNMIAVDTLVHNFLHRSGILGRFKAEHQYGPACYQPEGCADVITRVASQIDARECNPNYPKLFPRWVQHAIWRYCAQLEMGICNGNEIDDRFRCGSKGCPLFHLCDRVALQPEEPTG